MLAARILLAQRHLAMLICLATLLLKLLIPAGYMIDNDHGRVGIILCSGVAPATAMMDMRGMHGDVPDPGKPKDHGKAEMPCAFSSLSGATLGAIGPIQLAALIAFVMALGLAVALLPTPAEPARLRPPLRGPPLSVDLSSRACSSARAHDLRPCNCLAQGRSKVFSCTDPICSRAQRRPACGWLVRLSPRSLHQQPETLSSRRPAPRGRSRTCPRA